MSLAKWIDFVALALLWLYLCVLERAQAVVLTITAVVALASIVAMLVGFARGVLWLMT